MSVPMTGGYDPLTSGYGPPAGRVDIGGWLRQAWALFSARSGVWISAFLLCFLLLLIVWLLWAIPTGVLEPFRQIYLALVLHHPIPTPKAHDPFLEFARSKAFSLVLAAVDAVFAGGLFKMALRQARGEAITLLDLFSAFPQAVPLMLVAVAVAAVIGLLEGLCLWLMHRVGMSASLGTTISNLLILLPTYIVEGILMFAPLLIVDQEASAGDAILGSLRLLKKQWLMAVLAYFVFSLVGGMGIIACGIGMLVTYPLFLISIAVGYLAFTQGTPVGAWPPQDFSQVGVWPPPPTVNHR